MSDEIDDLHKMLDEAKSMGPIVTSLTDEDLKATLASAPKTSTIDPEEAAAILEDQLKCSYGL